jgi:uncharacterized ferritin-like protein (DUF455 family)
VTGTDLCRAKTLTEAAVAVLTTARPADKVALTYAAASAWRCGELALIGDSRPPERPARPQLPVTLPPKEMPKRRLGGDAGRIAMLHALAHIELNAIDLAWDIIARFAGEGQPSAFFADWVTVAQEEAEHFAALEDLLQERGSFYGALPAHDGLWEAAQKTAGAFRERLAIVPMTLEARALDTAPATISRLASEGEDSIVPVLAKILDDEISHVAAGVRWFDWSCRRTGDDPARSFQAIVARHFPKGLKAPFNRGARDRAGFPAAYYEPAAGKSGR